jgi:hypothetical protein
MGAAVSRESEVVSCESYAATREWGVCEAVVLSEAKNFHRLRG